MNNSDRNWYLVVGFIVLVILLIGYYQKKESDKAFNSSKVYVVGTVVEKRIPTKGDPVIIYEYNYRLEKLIAKKRMWNTPDINNRFLVAIAVDFEDQPFILLDYPVPDSIESPDSGWENIPKEIIDFKIFSIAGDSL
jgi:hypothetical protein